MLKLKKKNTLKIIKKIIHNAEIMERALCIIIDKEYMVCIFYFNQEK